MNICAASYDNIVSKVISDELPSLEKEIVSNFLDINSTQLTVFGITCINETLNDGEVCVMFRNNHFSCVLKSTELGLLVLLCDEGFLKEDIVWVYTFYPF